MKNLLDLHTHTLASGHAYSTLKENIQGAKEKGLAILGTSDHAKAMPGVTSNAFFSYYDALPRHLEGVTLLCGVEANIIDYQGSLDIDLDKRKVDFAIVSLHMPCILPGSREENTQALIGALSHDRVKIVGHPDDSYFPLDYDRLVPVLVERGIYAEVNNSSLKEGSPRKDSLKNLRTLLSLGRDQGLKIVMNSDAHFYTEVGNIEGSQALVEAMDYPKDLILNYSQSVQEVLDKLGIRDK
ncbi:MAG: phosphatase [Tissierellia bacterium]|nr:phosphatase [Tissierellia bacterium]